MKKELIEYFKSLEKEKQRQLVNDLLANISEEQISISVLLSREEQLTKSGVECPYCKSSSIVL